MSAKKIKNTKQKPKTKAKKTKILVKAAKPKVKTVKLVKKTPVVKKSSKKPKTLVTKNSTKQKKSLPAKKTAKEKPVKIIVKNKKQKKTPVKEVLVKEIKDSVKIAKKQESLDKKDEVKKEVTTSSSKDSFKAGEYVVYPSHGVGKVLGVEATKIMGQDFSCYMISFEREKLVVKVPVISAKKIGLRHLSTKAQLEEVLSILRSGVKKLKGMWSRRAQEYETKINSGDIILLAEVLRDLTRDIEDGERSYSERIIYETAINRLASEYSAVYSVDFEEAKEKVIITAKDKLMSESKVAAKDDFDEFDSEENEDADDDLEGDEDIDEDDDFEDEDDDFDDEDSKPRKKKK